ncbi:hypothetical protein DPEC_G00291390 [Dallia pectoralis]|uniref:Uncharacterized protein n=1 Tax=Dallia pectoralis TaxID=75939 RepID=A0ACC2FHX6_DALPE|nr:hypothetical protein DPEC_G00291390 [Dallia pectoralis]
MADKQFPSDFWLSSSVHLQNRSLQRWNAKINRRPRSVPLIHDSRERLLARVPNGALRPAVVHSIGPGGSDQKQCSVQELGRRVGSRGGFGDGDTAEISLGHRVPGLAEERNHSCVCGAVVIGNASQL